MREGDVHDGDRRRAGRRDVDGASRDPRPTLAPLSPCSDRDARDADRRATAAAQASAPAVSPERALVNRYCVTCHNERRPTPAGAPLMLDKLNIDDISHDPALWEKVVRKVRSGAMPPANLPRPDATTLCRVGSSLETSLDRIAAAKPNPGRPAHGAPSESCRIHQRRPRSACGRNRWPGRCSRPTIRATASTTSATCCRSRRACSSAICWRRPRSAVRRSAIRRCAPARRPIKCRPAAPADDRLSEDLPFGSRGGIAVRHNFPLDGEYVVKVDLSRNLDGAQIRGVHDMEIRDGSRAGPED